MNTEIRQGDQGTLVLEVTITDQELSNAIAEGVRHLSRRTRVPGFRPGKAPRQIIERSLGIDRNDPDAPDPVYDEAREHLYQRTVISALRDTDEDILEIPTSPEWTSFQEGVGASYTVRLPVRPKATLGDYQQYPFEPEITQVTDEQIDQVVEQLRDQQATLVPVEDRAAQEGDFSVISFEGHREGSPVEGAQAERFPLVIGNERMIPGFEANLVGMREDEEKTFTVTFPDDYAEEELAGQDVEFTAKLLELRERRLPEVDDDFAGAVGPYDDLAALRADLRVRMTTSALDRARHAFSDRIIEYATANASVEVPQLLIDREVEVMLDELKVRLGDQGIGYEDYLKVTERDEQALRVEYRDGAEHRVKVLLVLGAIADAEDVTVPDADIEAEIERIRADDSASKSLAEYLDSDRGRAYVRSQLRRSQTVELLVDRWIAAHPEFANVQHAHRPAETNAAAVAEEAAIEAATGMEDPDSDGMGAREAAEIESMGVES